MKRLVPILLLICLLLGSCASRSTDITREEIVEAYEAAGYSVSSRAYGEKLDYGQIGYVQADHPNGDYIYFSIFETAEEAAAYKKEFHHPIMMGLFSVIFGEPSWQRWKVYGCIVAQYDESGFLDPFINLLKAE